MVRVKIGKSGGIEPSKPKLSDALVKSKKHTKKHKDKERAKKMLLKKRAHKKKEDDKKHKKDKKKQIELEDTDDTTSSESDDMYSESDSDTIDDYSSSSSSSDNEGDNPFNDNVDIDRQLEKKIKPIKSLDSKSSLNMKIVSKDYVDICSQIHTLSKSLKADKADKKIIANLIYHYIKYFLYSCCIKKKPVFDWLEEFKDKIHIY